MRKQQEDFRIRNRKRKKKQQAITQHKTQKPSKTQPTPKKEKIVEEAL